MGSKLASSVGHCVKSMVWSTARYVDTSSSSDSARLEKGRSNLRSSPLGQSVELALERKRGEMRMRGIFNMQMLLP